LDRKLPIVFFEFDIEIDWNYYFSMTKLPDKKIHLLDF